MASPDRAHSRTFVVTGAASGIGLATARRLLAEGVSVVGADLAAPPDLGPRFTFVTADITDEAAVAAIVAAGRTASTGSSTPLASPAVARYTCSTVPNGSG
jgi:NAD(P)-dependent dehydrogenase (short-subunit alcohol dehydrogenase family)